MDVRVLRRLTTRFASASQSPGVSGVTYTDHRGAPRVTEVATHTCSHDRDSDRRVHLTHGDADLLVRAWALDIHGGGVPRPVLVHDGQVVVTPTTWQRSTVAELRRGPRRPLERLGADRDVAQVSWSAAVVPDRVAFRSPRHAADVDRELRPWFLPDTASTEAPAAGRFLAALDPQVGDLATARRLLRLGAVGSLQLELTTGTAAELGYLRTVAELEGVEVTELQSLAWQHAADWARWLWPAAGPPFNRHQHLPSAALRHAFEATALALHLVSHLPTTRFRRATSLSLGLLTEGGWQSQVRRRHLARQLHDELARLPEDLLERLAADCRFHERESEAARANRCHAQVTAAGYRAPAARDFDDLLPTALDPKLREAFTETLANASLLGEWDGPPSDPISRHLVEEGLW